ncbi:MAG TPA: STAS domain-containing protein [Gammaproteobacteria bacterium]|nr:STAS domain-containing protein [Gammaproteobacteria bacterium]
MVAEKKTGTGKKSRRKTSSRNTETAAGKNKTSVKGSGKQESKGNNIKIENDRELNATLILDDSLTISSAVNLKGQLSGYLGKYRKIEIDGASVESIDTAALQVIVSFITQLRRDSVEVSWTGKSEILSKTAALLGLTSYLEM